MRKFFLIYLLFLFLAVRAFSQDFNSNQHIDSLLIASNNRVYENPNESIQLGLDVLKESKYSENIHVRALMLISLAYTSKRDYKKALEYIIKASELSIKINDEKLQIEILFKTGILYQQLKIYGKSLEYIEKTEQLSSLYPPQDPIRKYLANSYAVKGFIYKENLNCDIALEFFSKSIKEYEQLDHSLYKTNLSIVYYNTGNCYNLLSDYDKAQSSFLKAIELANQEQASSLVSFAQKGLAEVFLLKGEHEKSISILQTALEKSHKVGDLVLNLGIYKGLFENYLALNQWNNYQKYFQLYLKTQLAIKNSERNSISDSISEIEKKQVEKQNEIQSKYKSLIKLILAITFLVITITFFKQKRNQKVIKSLQLKIKTLQNEKSNKKAM